MWELWPVSVLGVGFSLALWRSLIIKVIERFLFAFRQNKGYSEDERLGMTLFGGRRSKEKIFLLFLCFAFLVSFGFSWFFSCFVPLVAPPPPP